MIVFKILLIILTAAPAVALAVYLLGRMIKTVRRANRRERRIQEIVEGKRAK